MLKPSVAVQLQDGVLVAEFWDCLRLDPAPVSELKVHYDKQLRSGGRPDLIIDLNGVDFAGSSALGGFVSIQRLGRQHAGKVIVCNVSPQVREVFRVTKLESIFTFATDVSSALAELSETAARPASISTNSLGSTGEISSHSGAESAASSPPPPLRLRRRKS